MTICSKKTAEKVVRWYNGLGCDCETKDRLSRVLCSLGGGGGVSVSSIRSRPLIDVKEEGVAVPQHVSSVIRHVLMERSMTHPGMATAVFKKNKRYTFCDCNDRLGPPSVSVMMAWYNGEDDQDIEVTCPSCSSTYKRNKTKQNSAPLLRLLTEGGTEDLTEQLLALSLNASGGCGRNYQARFSTFSGSWSGLIFNTVNETIDGEVLVSNQVSTSCRLQPNCICSEILYAVSSILCEGKSNGNLFAYRPSEIKVLGAGGEFLYIKYPIFRLGGVFDRVSFKGLKNMLSKVEPDGLAAATADDNSDEDDSTGTDAASTETSVAPPPIKKPRRLQQYQREEEIVDESSSAVVIDSLMSMVLFKGGAAAKRSSHAKNKKNNNSGKRRNDEEEEYSGRFILPCPQLKEESVESFQRSFMKVPSELLKVSFKTGPDEDDDDEEVPVTEESHTIEIKRLQDITGRKVIYPVRNIIFSPPLIVRMKYNVYKVLSGLLSYFDHIEDESNGAIVILDDNEAHRSTLKLLSRIRERSLRKSVAVANANTETGYVTKKSIPTNDLSLSQDEASKREICSATSLNILSTLVR